MTNRSGAGRLPTTMSDALNLNHWRHRVGDAAASLARLLPPEMAHDWGMKFLENSCDRWLPRPHQPNLSQLGIHIPGIGQLRHPLALAAGFDKDARACDAWFRLGFSMIEVGTVTPLPQVGNPQPRLFRYKDQHAIINRMGFNSHGMSHAINRLLQFRRRPAQGVVGINVGKNKLTPEADSLREYVQLLQRFASLADYLVVNLSSPNTPGLRGLARPDFIAELALNTSDILQKVWIKFDPDSDRKLFQSLIEACVESRIAGVILTNTHGVKFPEMGGQSGHPLAIQSTVRLEWAHAVHKGQLPMIASGGVLSGLDAFQKIARGASAVQLWTALVYRGPWAVSKILVELEQELRAQGFDNVQSAVGSYYK